MIEIEDMSHDEVESLLSRVNYGHLGCSRNDHPYVVPIHFSYIDGVAYLYTTEGKKSEMMDANPEVCLQVEEVVNNENWSSVVFIGQAKRVTAESEREMALAAVVSTNPTLTPARSVRWIDNWVRDTRDTDVIYGIKGRVVTGRRTVPEE